MFRTPRPPLFRRLQSRRTRKLFLPSSAARAVYSPLCVQLAPILAIRTMHNPTKCGSITTRVPVLLGAQYSCEHRGPGLRLN
ncbi:hypothetical protein GY45DRAFT_514343 [Cubamyces sp. BRFM 1775]|nr:hypothetical protein GY45DRAFT_514343 [Cubamyces sp. BRFM 1775]